MGLDVFGSIRATRPSSECDWLEQSFVANLGEVIQSVGGLDPYFNNTELQLRQSVGGIAGVRFDISTWTALKLEYRVEHRGPVAHTGALSWAFGI